MASNGPESNAEPLLPANPPRYRRNGARWPRKPLTDSEIEAQFRPLINEAIVHMRLDTNLVAAIITAARKIENRSKKSNARSKRTPDEHG